MAAFLPDTSCKQKYPDSAFRQQRGELMLASAQALGDPAKMLAAAREILTADPANPTGLYWLAVLGPGAKETGEAFLTEVATACTRLLEASGPHFSSKVALELLKTPEAAQNQRAAVEAIAHRSIGWTQLQRGDLDGAEASFNKSLQLDAETALTSAWLGSVLVLSKRPEKQPQAIWHLARASWLDGDGALSSTQRRDVRALLGSAYVAYHGEMSGLEQVGELTRTAAVPPSNFTVESFAELMQRRQDEEIARTNPELLNWLKIRRKLLAADADAYFQTLTGAPTEKLKGYVIRCDSQSKATEVFVGLTEANLEEGVLKLSSSGGKCPAAGTEILFTGVPSAFTKEPFLFTVTVERDTIENWPASVRGR